jgi:hypothetical protein
MAPLDYDDAWERSREGPAFSNGTEGYGWQAAWCDRCLRDAPFRNGICDSGCPLLMIAIQGRIPAEWFEQPRDENGAYSIADQYHCVEFRAPGGGGGREPRPRPDPPGMEELFPRPSPERRMLTAAPLFVNGRTVETWAPAGELL